MEKQVLLFYIGNGGLKSALISQSKTDLPKILLLDRESLGNSASLSKKELEEVVYRKLDALAGRMQKAILDANLTNKKVNAVLAIVSAPWYHALTKTYKLKKDEPFLIKDKTITELLESTDKDSAPEQEEVTVLERKIIHIALNGYVTDSPINKKATDLEVSVIQSLTEKKFLSEIENILSRYFPISAYHFHTLALASFVTIRDILKETKDFLLINVTNLISEISLVKDNLLQETISIPIGFAGLLDKVSKALNVTPEVAFSLLKMYKGDQLEKQIGEKLGESLAVFRKEWAAQIGEAFKNLSGGVALPAACYLLSHHQLENLFADLIQPEDYSQFSFNQGEFHIRNISALDFVQFIDFNRLPLDSGMAVAIIFAKQTLLNRERMS
ncbi:MAG TPA: hypothetical protein VFA52_01420 [Candidatus Paceibacterota bacterium]|nr:hypothetical protein [Candidatus Paceibacterota bacterium]